METELCCPICNAQYSEDKIPRILNLCGHTFCENCIEAKIKLDKQNKYHFTCPEDNITFQMQNSSTKQFPINRALLKIAQTNKIKTPNKDSSFQLSKTTKQQDLHSDLQIPDSKDISDQNSSEFSTHNLNNQQFFNSPSLQQIQSPQEQNLCLLHQKPLQIVCTFDLKKICSKCAIFGQHKGHDFKSIEQFEQQKAQFCEQLKSIINKKSEIITHIEDKTSKSDLLSILTTKVTVIEKQIKQSYTKLIQQIKNQQKKVLNNLYEINKKLQKDIDDLYHVDQQLLDRFNKWQKDAQNKLKLVNQGSFQEQLEILLRIQSIKQNNTISNGLNLINQIQIQQASIVTKFQILLKSINLTSSNKIYQHLNNFIQVYQKIEQEQYEQKQQLALPQQLIRIQTNQTNLLQTHKTLQQNLLQIQDHPQMLISPDRTYNFQRQKSTQSIQIKMEQVKIVPFLQSKVFQQKLQAFQQKPAQKSQKKIMTKRQYNHGKLKTEISHQHPSSLTSRDNSFVSQKPIKLPKSKLKAIKVPQKYQKSIQNLYSDSLQTLDLTNAQLGDGTIYQICQLLSGSKVKTVKFIRNKLTDQGIIKVLPFLTDVINLNLSQNLLTQKILDVFIKNRSMFPKVKSIILSLNKIVERKHKVKIDQLRNLQIVVSV